MNNSTTTTVPPDTRSVGERVWGAFASGDLDGLTALLAPDFVLHVPGDHPQSGAWEGGSGLLEFLARSQAAATEEIELLDLLAGERHVAAYLLVRGTRAGREPLVNPTVHLLEVDDDGLVRSMRFHNADQRAVDAFWR